MAFEDVMGTVQRLWVATDALTAVGAQLENLEADVDVDPAIASALLGVLEAAGLAEIDDLAPEQRAMLLGLIRLRVAQANDLLADPGRPPGWTTHDTGVLDGYGRASMAVPALFAGAARELQDVTAFLDVGTGVGLLAVAAAKLWPSATIVGIDVWDPSLERARRNITQFGFGDRITIRDQDVTALDEVAVYDCAWVPTFFLAEEVLPVAIERVVDSLRPGGTVVLGLFEASPDPLARATETLHTIRGGGCEISVEEAEALLRKTGCDAIRQLPRSWPMPIDFVVGRKPVA